MLLFFITCIATVQSACLTGRFSAVDRRIYVRSIPNPQFGPSKYLFSLYGRNTRASIYKNCAAVIVHRQWLLTVAHCVYRIYDPKSWIAVPGTIRYDFWVNSTFSMSLQ
ncbi:hypothetical protein Ciccas_007532 [Cichlidogyrus casuarinus]|uniref:Peptidase S1 domain-containing protein n=1 Tax=Cichlidogyrus casuarinus TaxID=1844966 RepID=A0ABD2Q2M8_9PLAT